MVCTGNSFQYTIKEGDTPERIIQHLQISEMRLANAWWVKDSQGRDVGLNTIHMAYSDPGSIICIPYILSEEEQQRALEERMVDDGLRIGPAPLTQEMVDRLLAQLATAEHYEALLNTVGSDPTALLSEELLVPGQELSEEASRTAHRDWLLQYLENRRWVVDWRNYTKWDVERLEAEVRGDIIDDIVFVATQIYFDSEEHQAWERYLDNQSNYKTWDVKSLIDELNYFLVTYQAVVEHAQQADFEEEQNLVSSYYDTIDQAQIEVIIEEWNQEAERALLDELLTAINEMPPSILGVDVGDVKSGVLDYYGKMEARHQMLANIVRPRQEQEALYQEQEENARDYYHDVIREGSDVIDPKWFDASVSTDDLFLEAQRIAQGNLNTDREFIETRDEIYGVDSYGNLRQGAIIAGLLILSCVPVVGTAMDVIDGIRSLMMGDLVGAGLNLLGPLGEAVGKMRKVHTVANGVVHLLEEVNTSERVLEQYRDVLRAQDAIGGGLLDDLALKADELDEVVGELDVLPDISPNDYPPFRPQTTELGRQHAEKLVYDAFEIADTDPGLIRGVRYKQSGRGFGGYDPRTNTIILTGRGLNRSGWEQMTTAIHEIYHVRFFNIDNLGMNADLWIDIYNNNPYRRFGEEMRAWDYVRDTWISYYGTIPDEVAGYIQMRMDTLFDELYLALDQQRLPPPPR